MRMAPGPFLVGWTQLGRGDGAQELPSYVKVVEKVLDYTNSLEKAERILVRVICANKLQD